jgi:next to BRCA1 gene 1 protein
MHPACSDFDLCANCEALPIRVHPIEHPLLKIQSGSIPQFRRNAHAATCDACGQQIFDVRYKV